MVGYVFKQAGIATLTRIIEGDWKYLIILDACRFDAFCRVIEDFSLNGKLTWRFSQSSSTLEFVKKEFYHSDKFSDIIYVNANPTVDYVLGDRKNKIFYKFIPVWQYAWDEKIGTVKPEDTYYYALKSFVQYPNKRIIIHFLQPHYPFLGDKYAHINKIVKDDMERSLRSAFNYKKIKRFQLFQNIRILWRIVLKPMLSRGAIAGFPELYLNDRIKVEDIYEAYLNNLRIVMSYVSKLTSMLPGRIVITSDHGEAFGERLHPFLPIKIYGHISRIKIPSLIKVPWFIIDNNISNTDAIRNALREVIRVKLKYTRKHE